MIIIRVLLCCVVWISVCDKISISSIRLTADATRFLCDDTLSILSVGSDSVGPRRHSIFFVFFFAQIK